jgi:hypothetical protein
MKILLSNETPKNKPRKHAKKKSTPVPYQGTPPVPYEDTPVPYQGISNTESTSITTLSESLDAALSSGSLLNETTTNTSPEPDDEVIPAPVVPVEVKAVPVRKPGSFGALHPELSDEELDALAAKLEAEEAVKKQQLLDKNTAKAEYEKKMLDAVGVVFKAGGGMRGEAGNFVRLLSGTAKVGRKKKGQAPDVWDEQSEVFKDNPVTPEELLEWHRGWMENHNGISMVKDPVKVASSIDIFRRERQQKEAEVAPSTKMADLMNLHLHGLVQYQSKGA